MPLIPLPFPFTAPPHGSHQPLLDWSAAPPAPRLPVNCSARQHVPVDEFSGNLRSMVAHLRGLGVPAVVLITPPPVSEPDRIVHVEKASRAGQVEWGMVLGERGRCAGREAGWASAASAWHPGYGRRRAAALHYPLPFPN